MPVRLLRISDIYKVFLLFSVIVFTAGCLGGGGSKTPDTTRPSVSSFSPSSGQGNVAANDPVSIKFNERVNADSFSLTSERGTTISSTFSGNGSNTLTLSFSRILNYGTIYTATVMNIRDLSGNAYGNYSWSFTTTQGAPVTYHETPDSHLYDVGKYNSIALFNGKSYMSYYNASLRSLYLIATYDGVIWEGPYRVDGPAGNEKVGEYCSLVIDSAGDLHISYYYEGVGLKYAGANVSNIAGTLNTMVVDSGSGAVVGKYTSIAFDRNNIIHISYYDETNTALKYANNLNGPWQNSVFDSGNAGEDTGLYTAIKVADDGTVHISYYAWWILNGFLNGNLKYINTRDWQISTLDSTGNIGEFSSLALDGGGNVYVAYNHISQVDGIRRIRCITNASGVWRHVNVVTVGGNPLVNITSNPIFVDTNGVVHISYYSDVIIAGRTVGILYYISGVLYDPAFNLWDWSVSKVIDDSGIGDDILKGIYTSIVTDTNGKARISYYDASEGDMKFAQ